MRKLSIVRQLFGLNNKNAFGILTPWQFGFMQKVVAPTGTAEHENPVRAVRLGACDYYLNP